MNYIGIRMGSAAGSLLSAEHDQRSSLHIVDDEPEWRLTPAAPAASSRPPRVVATRWRSLQKGTQEVSAETAETCHVIGIALRRMDIRLAVSGRVVHDGVVLPGMLNVTEPGVAARGLFREPGDALHLHVPNRLIAECAQDTHGGDTAALPSGAGPAPDPLMERLGMALLGAEQLGSLFRPLYADSIGIAIVARLLASVRNAGVSERPRTAPLAKWRLKRAMDHVESHLAEPVSLADLASSAGLTRMHFAAQFKAATGLRPHEYLLRRRIERAQEMLAGSGEPVVGVALQVGFQTQAHFTSVFKRFAGQPPHAWRQSLRRAA